jgi:hypothetical protein
MTDEAKDLKLVPWQPMRLWRVGDLGAVMQNKSGPHCDPSPVHTDKRGNGPPPQNC